MTETIHYDTTTDSPVYKQFRLTISNQEAVDAIEEYQRATGFSERDLVKDAIIEYLETRGLLELELTEV